ncbi:MAG: diguanylate cyclase [Granulosicoccus sp.]
MKAFHRAFSGKISIAAISAAAHFFAQVAGCKTPEQLIGHSDHDVFSAEADLYVADDLEVMQTGCAKINIEEPQTTADGRKTWISTNKVPIRDHEGEVIGILGSYADITERVMHQKRVEHQARFDHLTALPNRLALKEEIETFSQAQTPGRGGLLFIDLDYFKTVNDTLGHEIGDQFLIQVAERITKAVDGRGFIARLGGDEFSVFAVGGERDSAQCVMTLIQNIAQDICNQITIFFKVGLHTIRLGVSIGVTEFDHATTNWADKFNEADIAMYEAKAAGRNRVLKFDRKMQEK